MKLWKKCLAVLLCGMMAAAPLAFAGCDKPEDDNDKTGGNEQEGNQNGGNGNGGSQTGGNQTGGNQTGSNQSGGNQTGGNETTVRDYVLEAEYIDLSYVVGGNTSATPEGSDLITDYATASNGKLVFSLYKTGLFIEFEFESSVAVDDAVLSFCFMASFHDFTMTDDEFQIYVNPQLDESYYPVDQNTRVKYGEINVSMTELKEFTITSAMHLNEGTNTVYLYVNNTDSLYPTASTMNAKAPDIDYMKISTTAVITQTIYNN